MFGLPRHVPGHWPTLALVQPVAIEPEAAVEDDDQEESILDHYFNLRADYQLELQLPIDLSKEEAERLATFVRSLPLEDFQ